MNNPARVEESGVMMDLIHNKWTYEIGVRSLL